MNIKINGEPFRVISLPTTQEDNHHGVEDRYILHEGDNPIGKLIKYTDGAYATFKGTNGVIKAHYNPAQIEVVKD